MNWLLIAIIAYFLYAVVLIGNKLLLKKAIPSPVIYSFYVGLLGILALFLIPFVGFGALGSGICSISLMAGMLFIFALIPWYGAMRQGEVSRAVPTVGSLVPIFTLLLAQVFLKERLVFGQLIAFFILVTGGAFLSLRREGAFPARALLLAGLAAFGFAFHAVLAKIVYLETSFWNGFIWMRIGGVLASLLLLPFFLSRKPFKDRLGRLRPSKISFLFLSNESLGGLAFILVSFAISLGSPTLINALQGIQYAFLLGLVVILSMRVPRLLQEEVAGGVLFQKLFGIFLVGIGLLILAFH